MNIVFRVDASEQIGTGHVMRCLTLADELRNRECQVRFISRNHPGNLGDMITRKGFALTLLTTPTQTIETLTDKDDYGTWLGVSQEEDAEETLHALGSDHPDWLIADHYGLGAKWEKILRHHTDRIMVIDDLADRKHDCDLLLDQNFFEQPDRRYMSLLPDHCEALFGPKYALIRPEFRQARKFCRMRGNGIARVLVYFGGNDLGNLTGMTLKALEDPELRKLLVDVVVGPNNPHLEKLEKQVQKRSGTRLHIQPEGFVELMIRADLCIGAGGTTTWERLCLNLRSLVITVAKNQEPFTEELNKFGHINWIGRGENMTGEIMRTALSNMITSFIDNNSSLPEIVDGQGVVRVAEIVMGFEA